MFVQEVAAQEKQTRRQVVLEGVLGSKVVLMIDGNRTVLGADESKDGVKVLSIQQNSATVEVDGSRRQLRFGDNSVVSSQYKKRESITVTVAPDARGMYMTNGSINELPVSFLVDTGATTIAMNAQQARRLGIDFRFRGKPTVVATASGAAKAYYVTLDKVSVGSITLRNITAVVIDGQFPIQVLLGMSFLGQLEIQHEGALMRLKKKY